jgi:hypothetical protein
MPGIVRMKALKSWRNREYEGEVSMGMEFDAVEHRARDLELAQLAVRVVAATPMQVKAEVPPRPLPVTESDGAGRRLSSLDPAQALREQPSPKRKGRPPLSSLPSTNRGA